MKDAILLLSPLVNVLVTAVFAGIVLRQYVRRHRIYQLYWSIGLVMAFVATLAYVLMIAVGPTSGAGIVFFRVYYILGAALVSAWLGLGSVALVTSKQVARVCFIVLCVLSVLAAALVALANVNMGALAHIAGTPGTGILQPRLGLWLYTIIILNLLGVLAVVGVAVYSGWKLVRRQSSLGGLSTSNILWANVLILMGDLLNGLAGTLARFLGLESTFWLVMSLGWVLFLAGVLLASQRPAAKTAAREHDQKEFASS
jgi:hypothetical protein